MAKQTGTSSLLAKSSASSISSASPSQLTTTVGYNKKGTGYWVSRSIAYIIFITWTLLTLSPLVWMSYSSFKTQGQRI